MVKEENNSAWADSDSEESSSGTSSSSVNEDEVQCLMTDETEEVFDSSSPEFTREDLVTALNEMVLEYKKLSQSFEEVKAERESCATNTELVSSRDMKDALTPGPDLLPHYKNCMDLQIHLVTEPDWAITAMRAVQ
ncbi:hypothetical protein F511_08382 [Dorcoceras hygrometricum]|uniref:Uncharacterized protein n=1 Tax=Dorcoceras hygrometricum TaxID=472368 RepID=A0A2Z7B6D2_9LAMI|nr:hypothetical protein F511_08382 [Dorcoceras hygrometricum]